MSRVLVHICLIAPYSDGFSYQENVLSKYHSKMGYETYVLASKFSWDSSGKVVCVNDDKYVDENGVTVIRLSDKQGKGVGNRFKTYPQLKETLEGLSPEIIFLHGCQLLDAKVICDYASRRSDCRLYVDNHADYTNSAKSIISKLFLHGFLWRRSARILSKEAEVFWGVLPARVDFLIERYGLRASQCKLLVMGADDDIVRKANLPGVRQSVRDRFGFGEHDLLICTGGKIDKAKKQVLDLMDVVSSCDGAIKLLVFGSVDDELRVDFESKLSENNILYAGWASDQEAANYFAASDVCAFPGRHSVYWELAAGLGKPLLLSDIPGTGHLERGKNSIRFSGYDADSMRKDLLMLLDDGYVKVMTAAARAAAQDFLYSTIAKRAICCEW